MRYQYNFGFLAEWVAANPQIKKTVILKALGIKADSGMKKWLEGRYPMPVISMLRLCNTFGIPLSAFFRDMDAEEQPTVIPLPRINEQLEPEGGYMERGEQRLRGESSIHNPLDVDKMKSVMPDSLQTYIPHKEQNDNQETQVSDIPCKQNEESTKKQTESKTIVSQTSIDTILKLEETHKAQIDKLLDIIDDLQKQNASLLQLVDEYRNRPYHVVQQYEPEESQDYGMVAEDLHNS